MRVIDPRPEPELRVWQDAVSPKSSCVSWLRVVFSIAQRTIRWLDILLGTLNCTIRVDERVEGGAICRW